MEENGDVAEKMDTAENGSSGEGSPEGADIPGRSGRPNLFELSSINHFGSTTYEHLTGSGSVAEKLRNRIDQGSVYLAADWHEVAYQKFYSNTYLEVMN